MSEPKYKIRVNYKSGISMEFFVSSFKVDTDRTGLKTYSWSCADTTTNKPIEFGANDVESVWQIGATIG